jgi:hypothetical protein
MGGFMRKLRRSYGNGDNLHGQRPYAILVHVQVLVAESNP